MHSKPDYVPGNGKAKVHCWVCGDPAITWRANAPWSARCAKHADRNPCAIEGCRRSCAADRGLENGDYWICGTHWKIGVPPRSRLRRQYHRYFRKAKKHGWETRAGARNNLYRQRFWMFWKTKLLPAARKVCEEHRLDIKEIHEFMGWEPPE